MNPNYHDKTNLADKTEKQLEEQVLKLPGFIRIAEKKVAHATESRDRKDLEVEVAKAQSIIASKAKGLTDSQCKAQAEVETESKQGELITADGQLRIAEVELNEYVNKFDAVRSAIKIRTATISSGLGGN